MWFTWVCVVSDISDTAIKPTRGEPDPLPPIYHLYHDIIFNPYALQGNWSALRDYRESLWRLVTIISSGQMTTHISQLLYNYRSSSLNFMGEPSTQTESIHQGIMRSIPWSDRSTTPWQQRRLLPGPRAMRTTRPITISCITVWIHAHMVEPGSQV